MAKEPLKSPQRRTLTKRLVQEAMLELLKSRSIQNITVRELCDVAGINRTTFYNHYDGVYEVLSEIEEHFLNQLSEQDKISSEQGSLEQHIESLCQQLKQNRDIALLLLANNADPNFSTKLIKVQEYSTVWQKAIRTYPTEERELLLSFVSGGAYTMVLRWLENGCRQSPKQLASLVAGVMQNGIELKL